MATYVKRETGITIVYNQIFRGEGVVNGEGGSRDGCLKWGGGGWGVIKGSFQKHLKTGGG